MCFHGNHYPTSIRYLFISLYSKYQSLRFICFHIMNSPVFPSLDDIYCMLSVTVCCHLLYVRWHYQWIIYFWYEDTRGWRLKILLYSIKLLTKVGITAFEQMLDFGLRFWSFGAKFWKKPFLSVFFKISLKKTNKNR